MSDMEILLMDTVLDLTHLETVMFKDLFTFNLG